MGMLMIRPCVDVHNLWPAIDWLWLDPNRAVVVATETVG